MKKKIAVFSTGWSGEIFSQFLQGMIGALSGEETDIMLFLCYATYVDTTAVKKGEMDIFDLPDMNDFDGAVLFGSGLDFKDTADNIIARCREADVPTIIQGTRRDGVSYVSSDNYQAVRDMCAHLIDHHGVKTITYFAGSGDSFDSNLRLEAIRDHLRDIGREDDLTEVFYTNWENAAATRRVNEICASGGPLPDAFICANDGLAMETCITLDNNGYDVPGDVLVCGFDHLSVSRIFSPSIASVDQCFVEMGAAAIKLWKELRAGAAAGTSEVVPCRFVPGESCGCDESGNSDMLRRRAGRERFSNRAMNTYFDRKLGIIEYKIMSCLNYQDLKTGICELLEEDHDFESDSFHLLLEPNFGLSIYDPDVDLATGRYSRNMEVVYSTEDGVKYKGTTFDPRGLIPGYDAEGASHLYVFLPLHEMDMAYGYLIFRDCLDKIEPRSLHIYQNRMSSALDKFRHALTLDIINKRLMDLMRRDPLTKVNNRMAFEDKEKSLQAMMNSDPDARFAVAMFDVNSLKLINDWQGHEAGDAYLLRACRLICNVFKHSPVYRIGGDEFVAVLIGEDLERADVLMKTFNERLSPYSDVSPLPIEYVSVACGLAVYDPRTDQSVSDVVNRADEEMYRDKAAKKQDPQG